MDSIRILRRIAPEIVKREEVSNKADVYSFGCIISEVISEVRCWSEKEIKDSKEVEAAMDFDV